MEVSFPDVAAIIKEFRIWWINAGVGGVLLFGGVLIVAIIAYRLPSILTVCLEHRRTMKKLEKQTLIISKKITAEQNKRAPTGTKGKE